jgi:hypothetical protein
VAAGVVGASEEHLRDAVAAGIAEGLTEDEAHHRAVRRSGPPSSVARAHRVRLRQALENGRNGLNYRR